MLEGKNISVLISLSQKKALCLPGNVSKFYKYTRNAQIYLNSYEITVGAAKHMDRKKKRKRITGERRIKPREIAQWVKG